MIVHFDPRRIEDYRLFLRVKKLPRYEIQGHTAIVPDEYAGLLNMTVPRAEDVPYEPSPFLFGYQRDISRLAIMKRKFACFIECGLGKTLIFLEFARHVCKCLPPEKRVLIVSPLMVIKQTLRELQRFYGDSLLIEQVPAKSLSAWMRGEGGIGITNYEAITDRLGRGNLGALILDESSMMKCSYSKWSTRLIELGRGIDWKLCLTGTPAPNDRIEYANHAVFLDRFPTTNSFLAKFFVNRGQTDNRWEMKAHALRPFYLSLSDWCIFMSDPGTYGWMDNAGGFPPVNVTIHDVPLTEDQQARVAKAGGDMFGTPGGITSRAKLSQLAKGRHNGQEVETLKPAFIRNLIATWPDESTIVWCLYNAEQDTIAKAIPGCVSMTGSTPEHERERMIADFQAGRIKVLVSKSKILGFGLNLQIATRQVFSGLMDSFESYHQCVKRSNRIGSTRPLNVHIPVTSVERAMVDNVLRKAHLIDRDTKEQEAIFKEVGIGIIPGLQEATHEPAQ